MDTKHRTVCAFMQELNLEGAMNTIDDMVVHPKDKEAFSTRLNMLLDAVGAPPIGKGRQGYLALMFDVSDKGGRKWIRGESIPRYEILLRIVEKYRQTGVTVEWLLTGDENLSPFKTTIDSEGKPLPVLKLEAWRLPVLDWDELGDFMYSGENASNYAKDWVDTTTRPHSKTFALRVEGDAMEPLFTAGMLITIEPELDPQPGDYVIAQQPGGQSTFKQLTKDGADLYLKPLNNRYPIKALGADKIIGVVREAVIKFR
jgi:SOS-response transcriptional repressor LexA